MDVCVHHLEIMFHYFSQELFLLLGCIIKYFVLFSPSKLDKVYSQHFTKQFKAPIHDSNSLLLTTHLMCFM